MSKISDHAQGGILGLQDDLRAALKRCDSLEAAAQATAGVLYEALRESAVLVRFFATIRYGLLPAGLQARVQELACINTGEATLRDDALVLTLLGTRGARPAWDRREQSAGHAGIPLVSTVFIEAIPMVSRLLGELGVDLRWFDHRDRSFVERKLAGGLAGFFHVRDAATTLDALGRHIIPAQDFVAENGVKTVFGLGGAYPEGTMLTLVVFTRELLDKAEVEPYVRLISTVKATTAALVRDGRFFPRDAARR